MVVLLLLLCTKYGVVRIIGSNTKYCLLRLTTFYVYRSALQISSTYIRRSRLYCVPIEYKSNSSMMAFLLSYLYLA